MLYCRTPTGQSREVDGASQTGRTLNAVALHDADFWADCEVVRDRPHDRCLVCWGRSHIARVFGAIFPSTAQG
jgi:hypothetical protein